MCIDRQRGISLVETIVFMVIVSVGVIGLVSVLNPMIRSSADPMVTKQSTVIAESLLNEILHQPFTWCDPDDPAAATAQSYGDCSPGYAQSALGPTVGEVRGGNAPGTGFDNVADYAGFGMDDVTDAAGNNAMAGFRADVVVTHAGTALGLGDNTAALQVTVSISNGSETFSLTGYRFRYAPRI
jgi:MSHA pilin protein MshD